MFQRDPYPASFKLKPKNAKANGNQKQVKYFLKALKTFFLTKHFCRCLHVQL